MKKLLKLATGSHPGKAVGETPSAPGAGEALPERRSKEDSSRGGSLRAFKTVFSGLARGGSGRGRWQKADAGPTASNELLPSLGPKTSMPPQPGVAANAASPAGAAKLSGVGRWASQPDLQDDGPTRLPAPDSSWDRLGHHNFMSAGHEGSSPAACSSPGAHEVPGET
jgi:hypothetical protein